MREGLDGVAEVDPDGNVVFHPKEIVCVVVGEERVDKNTDPGKLGLVHDCDGAEGQTLNKRGWDTGLVRENLLPTAPRGVVASSVEDEICEHRKERVECLSCVPRLLARKFGLRP